MEIYSSGFWWWTRFSLWSVFQKSVKELVLVAGHVQIGIPSYSCRIIVYKTNLRLGIVRLFGTSNLVTKKVFFTISLGGQQRFRKLGLKFKSQKLFRWWCSSTWLRCLRTMSYQRSSIAGKVIIIIIIVKIIISIFLSPIWLRLEYFLLIIVMLLEIRSMTLLTTEERWNRDMQRFEEKPNFHLKT